MSATGPRPASEHLATIFRLESGRCVATLVRIFDDIDIAEEAVQEAFTIATEKWPTAGVPPNPGAWITTAKNRAIDRIRREASRDDRNAQAALLHQRDEPAEPAGPVKDDRLRLFFTCCHPALAPNVQVALPSMRRPVSERRSSTETRSCSICLAGALPSMRPGRSLRMARSHSCPAQTSRLSLPPRSRRSRGHQSVSTATRADGRRQRNGSVPRVLRRIRARRAPLLRTCHRR